jgi:hypothetical protein
LSSNVHPVPVKMDIPIKGACLVIKISVAYFASNEPEMGFESTAELHAQQKKCVKSKVYNFKECLQARIERYAQLSSVVFIVIAFVRIEFLNDKFCVVF